MSVASRRIVVYVIVRVQRVLLVAGNLSARLLRNHRDPVSWVVGVDEIASMVRHISGALPGSYSVALSHHPFYDFKYDLMFRPFLNTIFSYLVRLLRGPFMLGWLTERAEGFIYIGFNGFLISADHREYEFQWLHQHGVRIVCYFVGDDIRAPRLMHKLEAVYGRPNISSVIGEVDPHFESEEYDQSKRGIAAVTDKYADAIFSAPVDQRSYLKREVLPIAYFLPDDQFTKPEGKFREIERIVVLHSPSSPTLKGTSHVRDAIKRLKCDGYDFEYVELVGVTNREVRAQLARAHIVLNQFYGFLPGVFGVEALASMTAMLCSADELIEPTLPRGANKAWIVTSISEIYSHTKYLLDNKELIRDQAEAGFSWAREHWSTDASGKELRRILSVVSENL